MSDSGNAALESANRQFNHYGMILKSLAVSVWTTDPFGQSLSVIAGEECPEGVAAPTSHFVEMLHEDDQVHLMELLAKSIPKGLPFFTIVRSRTQQGWRTLRIQMSPVRDQNGTLTEWIGVATDVSRLEEAEQRIRLDHETLLTSQERLHIAMQAARMGIWEFNLVDDSLVWSDNVKDILNLDAPITKGEDFKKIIHPEDLSRNLSHFAQAVAQHTVFDIEFRIIDRDRNVRWLMESAKPYFDKAGKPTHVIGVVQDITEQKSMRDWNLAQNRALQLIADGEPLQVVLAAILEMVEQNIFLSFSTIMLAKGDVLRPLLGPNAPLELLTAIDPLPIGPDRGSCGTAAFRKETVIVEDMETDPLFNNYRELARRMNVRRCWSVPILSGAATADCPAAGKLTNNSAELLGVIAVYRADAGRPSAQELACVAQAARVAAIAICRHRSDTAIREKQQRFEDLANTIPELIWTSDKYGNGTYCNRQLLATLGTLCNANWTDVVHPDDRHESLTRYQAALQTKGLYSVEHRMRVQPSGEYRWFYSRAAASRDSSGEIDCWYGVATDINDLKLAEHALREDRDRMAALAEASPAVLFSCLYDVDQSMHFKYLSPSVKTLFGLEAEMVYQDANRLMQLIDPDDLQTALTLLHRMQEENNSFSTSFRMQHQERGNIWIEVQAAPRRITASATLWHGILLDITERKQIEERLLQAEKMEAIGNLAGGVAHDFNNLLTVIFGSCDMLQLELKNHPECHNHLNAILYSADRAYALTKQLLLFSQSKSTNLRLVNINDIIGEIQSILQRLLGNNSRLELHLADHVELIHADPMQIEQILLNLTVNARDAMPDGGTLTISTKCHEGGTHPRKGDATQYVEIEVADSGVGIDPNIRQRIFEPFFSTKPFGKGTGLGLAVVHGIVSNNHGTIDVEPRIGGGTIFRVWLPVAVADAYVEHPLETPIATNGSKKRVLLVDDDPQVRQIVKDVLETKFTVITAGSVDEALSLHDELPKLDILVTDIAMPGRTGDALADELQRRQPNLPVIFISGHSHSMVGTEKANRHLLAKPFALKKLVSLVQQMVQSAREQS